MKKIIIPFLALCVSAGFAADVVETTTTKTVTTSGTIHEYVPGKKFILKEESGPVIYGYDKEVVYVTRDGKTIAEADLAARLKSGARVKVHYHGHGDKRYIKRIEVED